jgi:putative phosphonate transport system ATP-binding protein
MGSRAGANVGERLMAVGARITARSAREAHRLAGRVEIDADRIDDRRAPSRAACASACRSPATS